MKIGLALAGGGIKGVAHAGALRALEENNIRVDIIGGTSSGSIVASLYAMGYSAQEIYNFFIKYGRVITRLDGNRIRKEIKNFIFTKKIKSMGINSGEFIEDFFNKIAREKSIKYLSDIDMPLVIPAVNISNSEKYIFTSKKTYKKNYISTITVGKAVRASSSFPIVYEPVKFKGDYFLDGGLLQNIPTEEVKEAGADKVISMAFTAEEITKESNAMNIVIKVADIMGTKSTQNSLNASDYNIMFDVQGVELLDVKKIDECYKIGYETTKRQIKEVKKLLLQEK